MLSKGLSKVVTLGCKACGLALILSGIAGHAAAVDVAAPEIDPGSASSALTLLIGGVLMLTDRIRRK